MENVASVSSPGEACWPLGDHLGTICKLADLGWQPRCGWVGRWDKMSVPGGRPTVAEVARSGDLAV